MLTAFTNNFVFYYFVCCLRFCSLHLNNILQIAETVRNTGKPSFQTLSLTSIPLNDSHTTYRGVFLAPPDTQFRFKGEMIGVTKGLLLYKLSWDFFFFGFYQFRIIKSSWSEESLMKINNFYDFLLKCLELVVKGF